MLVCTALELWRFDFRVQFRVNQEQEIGANQIIDWKFEVGKKKFAYLSDDDEPKGSA